MNTINPITKKPNGRAGSRERLEELALLLEAEAETSDKRKATRLKRRAAALRAFTIDPSLGPQEVVGDYG